MTFSKMLRWLGVGVTSLMVFASAASATTITSPTGTVYTSTIQSENEGGHVKLHTPMAVISCASTLQSKVESDEQGKPASGKVSSLTFGSPVGTCTDNWHVTVVTAGTLDIHGTAPHNGELTSNGLTIDVTRLGVTCLYKTENTPIGTITGGNPATFHIAGVLPVHAGSSALCGEKAATWTGSYKVTTPGSMYVDPDF